MSIFKRDTRGVLATALADPPPPPAPGCSAAEGQPRDRVKQQVADYLNANPQTKSGLEGIRQPIQDMKARCS